MSNPDHINKLMEGAASWNAWRDRNPTLRPDLSGANLTDLSLGYGNLSGADLSGADLSKAVLFNCALFEANLTGANLHWAYLGGSILMKVNLSRRT
jgi:uncharacterized protein YjbI with pentapeptide repeats